MCGIAGFITSRNAIGNAERVLTAMCDAIQHRGPDSSGAWVDQREGVDSIVALGHRRLAIQDLTEAGAQPMVSVDGR